MGLKYKRVLLKISGEASQETRDLDWIRNFSEKSVHQLKRPLIWE